MKKCPLCGRIYTDTVEECPKCVIKLASYPFRWKIGIDDPRETALVYAGPPKMELPDTPPTITIDL